VPEDNDVASTPRSSRRSRRAAADDAEDSSASTTDASASAHSSKRSEPALSLQSPYGKSQETIGTPVPVLVRRPSQQQAQQQDPSSAPAVAPRPTLFHAISRLKVAQLRLIASSAPHEFHRPDAQQRTVGDMLWHAVRDNGITHPQLQPVIEFLIKQKVSTHQRIIPLSAVDVACFAQLRWRFPLIEKLTCSSVYVCLVQTFFLAPLLLCCCRPTSPSPRSTRVISARPTIQTRRAALCRNRATSSNSIGSCTRT
jgi:hypothetical protein